MKTTYSSLKFRILKTLNAAVFVMTTMLSVQACQFHTVQTDELSSHDIRNHHAKELLPSFVSADEIRAFNGDNQFNKYISNYIQNNSALDSKKLTRSLVKLSRENSYDPIFLLAIIKTESKFNPNAIGSHGEIGLMQIKPDTAEWICKKLGIHWRGAQALKDPAYNVMVGSYYFKYLKKVLNSKSLKYISAYNMGLGALKRKTSKQYPYFDRVIENYLAIYSELKLIKQSTAQVAVLDGPRIESFFL